MMTRDDLAEVIRLTVVGIGHRVDQIELVEEEGDQSLMAYIYEDSAPDGEVRIFLIPDRIAGKIV